MGIAESMEPKLLYFQDRFFSSFDDNDGDDNGLSNMVRKHPSLLTYGIDTNIEPKIAFFANEVYGGSKKGEIAALRLAGHDPKFLSYSLEKRLRPRLKEIRELGIEQKMSIGSWVKLTPAKWDVFVKRKLGES